MRLCTRIITLFLLLSTASSSVTIAQEIEPSPREISPANAGKINKSVDSSNEQMMLRMFDIIDKIGIIIPGQGFKSIKIGDSRGRLIQLLGQPQQASKKALQYQLGPKTVLQFLGKKQIDEIIIYGGPGSLAHVNNGVLFGMSPAQTVELFKSAPDKQGGEAIRYDDLGIELFFEKLALFKIRVYAP